MRNLLKKYSDTNPERFNSEFIYFKKNDPLLPYLDNIFKALEIIDGITYVGSTINTDESTFNLKKVVEADDEPTSDWMPISVSRMNLVTAKFKIEKEDNNVKNKDKVDADGIRREDIELKILFPKLINDFYFYINNSKRFPIYQIIDAGTYVTNKQALTLKTLFMPIVLRKKPMNYTTVKGEKISNRIFLLDLFRSKTNVMYYMYAKMGFNEAIEFMLKRSNYVKTNFEEDDIKLIIYTSTEDIDDEDYLTFKISNKLFVNVYKEAFNECTFVKDITFNVIHSVTGKKIRTDNENYWKKNLGRIFATNTNAQLEKAEKTLLSFKRIMDQCTKDNLRIDTADKDSTFTILRWMILYYDNLTKLDNMDLKNKRIRLNEYLINPLLMKFSANTYRALNSRTLTFSTIRSIFNNIGPNFIIKNLFKNELLRYSSSVNTIDLFSSALKFSFKGPQSFADKADAIEGKYRSIHPSYLGRIGLSGSSNGDPGLSGCFSPFISNPEEDPFYFVTEEEFRNQFEFNDETL